MALIRAINQKKLSSLTRSLLSKISLTEDDVAVVVSPRGELLMVRDSPGGIGFPDLSKPLARFNWSDEEWSISVQ